MTKPTDNLDTLAQEVKHLSGEIASLKRKANLMEPGPDCDQLRQDLNMKQYQALFYIEKMGNVSNLNLFNRRNNHEI